MKIKTFLLTLIYVCGIFQLQPLLAAEKEPEQNDGIYCIGSEDELLWFASAVNGGQTDINAVLTKDIELSENWTPIGKSSQKYGGTFNGNGYTVSGLKDSSGNGTYHGLFGYISSTGTVKNISVDGEVISNESSGYAGGVAGYNEGTIISSISAVEVSGKKYIGGVAGYNAGNIEKCINRGTIEAISSYSYVGGIGGIVGYNTGVIEYSVNCGNVINTGKYGYYTGGIVGRASGNMNISFSYNTATVSGYNIVGGIIGGGEGSGKIEYVYSLGTVTCGYSSSYAKKGGIAGNASSNMCEYAYFLQDNEINTDLSISGSGTQKNSGGKTETELKDETLLPLLGGAFEKDSGNINGGYPILKWQNPDAVYKIVLTVLPVEAEVVMKNSAGNSIESVKTNGVYTFSNLKKGDYTCEISLDGYETQIKNITVSAVDIYTEIHLEKKKYKTVFEVVPAEANFALKNGEEELQAKKTGNIYEYNLENGIYTYSANLFGYESVCDNVEVSGAPSEEKIILEKLECAKVCIKLIDRESMLDLTDITVSIKYGEYDVLPETDGQYMLPPGEYEYVIKSSGYAKIQGTFEVNENDVKNGKIVQEYTFLSTVWDGDCDEPKIKDGVWQITSGNELAWLAANVNNADGNTSYDAVLVNDINLGDLEWTPIGAEIGYKQYTFNGVFDGNGKTISGLKISGNVNNLGLFGKISSSSEIKNLKVCGTVKETLSGKSYIGGIAGYNAGTIADCISMIEVESNGKYTGGICGYSIGKIKSSRNIGTVKGNGDYTGGITGYASGELIQCENRGEVSFTGGSGWYTGGICGYSQNVKISECANMGKVFASGTNAGGVVGKICSGTVISDTYNSADVSSKAYTAGGFAGATYGSDSNIKIENCYSSGNITDSPGNCGAFIGYFDGGTIKNCYTVIEKSDDGINTGLLSVGKGTLNGDEIELTVDYSKLNVNKVWKSTVFYNSGKFPYLVWQSKVMVTADGKEVFQEMSGKKKIEVRNETGIDGELIVAYYKENVLKDAKCGKDYISSEYNFENGDILKIFFWGKEITPIENVYIIHGILQ